MNCEPRCGDIKPTLLILHYTGMSSAEKAIDWLARAESKVSCHYVVDEFGAITQLVPECQRAWHAGVSFWRGETDINSHSIGIEIQNPGHEHGYPDFSEPQMRGVLSLCQDIISRHDIAADGILAHSDVAPERKIDPGEKFNWAMLAREGVGLWLPPDAINDDDAGLGLGETDLRVASAQAWLAAYGYDAPQTGVLDAKTSKVIRAFQLHFRPARVDGRLDVSTENTLACIVQAAGRDASI